jgi:hypothetical protein
MNSRRLGALAFFAVAALGVAGCANEPTRVQPGASAADTLQRLGAPTGRYPAHGRRRTAAVFAHAGRLRGDRHRRRRLGQGGLGDAGAQRGALRPDIKVDQWRQNDVMAFYGRPYEISRVSSFDGAVWTWRYKSVNERRMLYIYIDPTGVVRRYHTGDDLELDRVRD